MPETGRLRAYRLNSTQLNPGRCANTLLIVVDLQKQIDKLGDGHAMPAADVAKTLVVGGLQGFDSLPMATEWLTLKMKELQGPMHTGTYIKSPSFQGLMFVKFRSGYERDLAVGILRSARLKHGDENVWATQDLPGPIPVRARKLLLIGLRWQLGEWGFVKKEFEIDDLYTHLRVRRQSGAQGVYRRWKFQTPVG